DRHREPSGRWRGRDDRPPSPGRSRVMTVDSPHMPEETRALSVLVVEDELLIRWSIAETLESGGHSVMQAEDGASALALLNAPAAGFDVVLLDYRLPDSNDLQLLASVRRLSPRSVVILMTAYGTQEVVNGALGLGVSRVMSKPFDVDGLGQVLLDAWHAAAPH